ncbi:unnamed protein product, partial [Oppiella nova]
MQQALPICIKVSAVYCGAFPSAPALQLFVGSTLYTCSGKDGNNFTHITTYSRDQACTPASEASISDNLVQSDGHGKTSIVSLQQLASSQYPADGGLTRDDILYLATSGSLEGKYVYEKIVYLDEVHLKRCSSVLGYSYVPSQTSQLLISDTLDLNVLINPAGAYDAFRKGCTTLAQYIVPHHVGLPVTRQLFVGSIAYKCNGKDGNNYTHIASYTRDASCTQGSGQGISNDLVQCTGHGQYEVSELKVLAASGWDAGSGLTRFEALYLALSGPVEGKYVYERVVHLDEVHLSRCSSVLGYSYVTASSATLLISDSLDLSVLIAPTGAFDAFRTGCTTVCDGTGCNYDLAKQLFVGSIAYKCNGKDGNNNYTHIQTFSRDQSSTPPSGQTISDDLVQCTGHGQYEVSELKVLAASGWDAGSGLIRHDTLYLELSGPVQGKYVYEKVMHLDEVHLSRCSSVLGYTYVSQSATLLISDTLDLSVLIAPTGSLDAFRTGCTTVCDGSGWVGILAPVVLSQGQPNPSYDNVIVACSPNQHNQIIQLKPLAGSIYPAGAFTQVETLWQALTGPLEGRYLYEKLVILNSAFLKKCSSILGYSYVSSKIATLLVIDQLTLAPLITPTGAFEAFKKGCTTICQGRAFFDPLMQWEIASQ